MESINQSADYNQDPPKIKENTETSSDTPSANDSGESAVQEGDEIVNAEDQNTLVNDETAEEYLDNVNNISIPTDGKSHNQVWMLDEDDDDDDEDDDDDDDDGMEIGDDPDETKKKMPVM